MRDARPDAKVLPPGWNRRFGELLCTVSRLAVPMARLSSFAGLLVDRLNDAGARIQTNAKRGVGFLEEAPPDLVNLSRVYVGGQPFEASHVLLKVPTIHSDVRLRLQTSDIRTFEQIFLLEEYGIPELPESAETIVDLGANIGLASIYFGARYPKARILAIEPDAENYDLMAKNTAPLGSRVLRRNIAAWKHDGFINIHSEDDRGEPLGAWGFRVSNQESLATSRKIECARVRNLLDHADFQTVDIMKIDIEGAELDLFSVGADEWLKRVRYLIIETHDTFRPGSEKAVRDALGADFDELPRSSENLIFRRKEPLLQPQPVVPRTRGPARAKPQAAASVLREKQDPR